MRNVTAKTLNAFLHKVRIGYRSYLRTEDTFKRKNSIKAVRIDERISGVQ